MIDVHCHLTYPGLREILEEVIKEARGALRAMVTCGFPVREGEREGGGRLKMDLDSARKALRLSRAYGGFVYVTLGLHPVHAARIGDGDLELYMEFIKDNRDSIAGIGEIGLDRHWIKDESLHERSKDAFLQLLGLAEELDLPVVLHFRKAEEEGYKLVSNTNLERVLFHSFSGNMTTARKIAEQGYRVSLNTRIWTTKNAKKIARRFPLELLLTETDSPFLSPTEERVNRPVNVRIVVDAIARLRGITFEEADRATTRNAMAFYGLGERGG